MWKIIETQLKLLISKKFKENNCEGKKTIKGVVLKYDDTTVWCELFTEEDNFKVILPRNYFTFEFTELTGILMSVNDTGAIQIEKREMIPDKETLNIIDDLYEKF